ncbi:hypothetical protein LEP1GSC021_3393 [Leptospira noguchii str. 1993005606]|nr:hypothetical protein LEP1GSC021_3393 [Leptospira noguchii str. 1993005606]
MIKENKDLLLQLGAPYQELLQKNHRPSDFYTKSLFCGHYQNLNPI